MFLLCSSVAVTPLPASSPRLVAWAVFALVACAVVALRWPGLDAGFSIDDRPLLTSPVIADASRLPELFAHNAMYAAGGGPQAVDTYRPISIASFMLDHARGGVERAAYHMTNLVAHLLACALAFAFARRVLPGAHPVALGGALVFVAAHPAGAEAHVWMNGRSDVLMTLFGLAGLLILHGSLHARGPLALRAAGVVAASALWCVGCLAKETLILAFPGLIVLALTTRRDAPNAPHDPPRTHDLRRHAAAAATAAIVATGIYTGLRLRALDGVAAGGSTVLSDALRRLGLVWFDGAGTFVAPTRLAMRQLHTDYALLPDVVGAPLTLTALVLGVGALVALRARPLAAGPLLVFAGTMAPVAVLTLSPDWPGMNRYLYLTLACSLPALAAGLDAAWRASARARTLTALGLAVVSVLWALGFARVVALYRSPATFAQAVYEENPRAGHGWALWGGEAMAEARWQEAAQIYGTAIEASAAAGVTSCRLHAPFVRALRRAEAYDAARAAFPAARAACDPPPPSLLEDEAVLWRGLDDEVAVTALLRCLRADAPGSACPGILPAWRKPGELPEPLRLRLDAFLRESTPSDAR